MRLPFCRPTKKGFPAAKFSFLPDPGIGPSRWSPNVIAHAWPCFFGASER